MELNDLPASLDSAGTDIAYSPRSGHQYTARSSHQHSQPSSPHSAHSALVGGSVEAHMELMLDTSRILPDMLVVWIRKFVMAVKLSFQLLGTVPESSWWESSLKSHSVKTEQSPLLPLLTADSRETFKRNSI